MSVLYTNCFGLPPAAVYPPPTVACSSLNCTQRYRIASCRLGNRVPRCHIACGYTTFQSWAVLRRVPEDDTQKLQWVLSTNVSRRRRPPAVSWVLSSTLHAMCGSALAWPAAAPRGNNHMWSEVALLLRSSAARAARTGPALSRLAGPDLASATHQKNHPKKPLSDAFPRNFQDAHVLRQFLNVWQHPQVAGPPWSAKITVLSERSSDKTTVRAKFSIYTRCTKSSLISLNNCNGNMCIA